MIQIANVTKKLGDKEVIKQIQWDIHNGRVYGLVGPNGAGKSTLLRLIAGVYRPDEGAIMVDDQPVFENPSNKETIFFVSDDPYFLHQSNLLEMKAFYKLYYPSFDEALYQNLVQAFGLSETARIHTFSKGMKRQASIILALAVSPNYLLMDEAFDGLDPVMRLTLKRIISDEIINRQLTVIISSHNIRELEDICDEIALIQNGIVNLHGDIAQIREDYHKYQLAFNKTVDSAIFETLRIVNIEIRSKIATLIVKGESDLIRARLKQLDPILLEELPLSMEDIFVYEMKEQGYGKNI